MEIRWEHAYEYMKKRYYDDGIIVTPRGVAEQFPNADVGELAVGISEFKLMMKEINGITV